MLRLESYVHGGREFSPPLLNCSPVTCAHSTLSLPFDFNSRKIVYTCSTPVN